MSTKMDVIIAGFPGLFIKVPYREHESIQYIQDRVSNILDGSTPGPYNNHCKLYIDGILVEDYTRSIYDYSLFGKTVTYKGCASLFANARTPPPNILFAEQYYQQLSTNISEKAKITEQEKKVEEGLPSIVSVEGEVQKSKTDTSGITINKEKKFILKAPKFLTSIVQRQQRLSASSFRFSEESKKRNSALSTVSVAATLSLKASENAVPGDFLASSSSIMTLKVVTAEGKSVTVDLKEKATVQDLKEKLSYMTKRGLNEKEPLPVSDQFLFFNGSVLENEYPLSKYTGIQAGEIQFAMKIPENYDPQKRQKPVCKGPNPVKIFVKTLTGKTITIFTDVTTESVEGLKLMVEYEEAVPPDQQRMVYAGKQLEDERLLNEYNIQKESVIHLILRLRGGGGGPTMFADVSNSGGLRKLAFSQDAPKGRMVAWGTNIEIECECTPSHRVIYNKGMGVYELGNSFTQCPNCHRTNVKPITVGFAKCQYRIHGVKGDGTEFKSDWKKVSDNDAYQRYDPSDQVSWKRLGIESKNLNEQTEDPCCTICLEDVLFMKTSLPCGHQFHTSCISRWKLTCPNCRASRL